MSRITPSITPRSLIVAATALALLGTAVSASAFTAEANPDWSYVNTAASTPSVARTHLLPDHAEIAVARVDRGRLITIPFAEMGRWDDMKKRTGDTLRALPPGAYLNAVPEIDYGSLDTDNKLDEMRLAAVDEGFDYLMVYGLGEDAYAGTFGRRALSRTGWIVPHTGPLHSPGQAKAVIVETRTGRVLGATNADQDTRNINDISDQVARLIRSL